MIRTKSRISKNIRDVRDFKEKQKYESEEAIKRNSLRQIYTPGTSKKITSMANAMANSDRGANKGKGTLQMKSPAGKVTMKFQKRGK